MMIGLLEDTTLYKLAGEVVPGEGSGVENAQISGLLSTIRSSGSCAVLRTMAQRQLEKSRREGDHDTLRTAFYDRLFKALQEVEKHADEYVRMKFPLVGGKVDRKQKEHWSGRLALTLMTHIAAEHRWQQRRP